MKKTLIAILLTLTLSGCQLEDYFTKKQAKEEFKSLCDRYTLAMCSELVIPEYNNADMYEVRAVSYDIHFEYESDNGDKYDYLESAPHRGDCEDWTITFIENNLRLGNFKKGQVKWVFGTQDGSYHAWTLVIFEDEEYLFDNGYQRGTNKEKAYEERNYKSMFTLFSY